MSNVRSELQGATHSGALGKVAELAPLGMVTLRGDLGAAEVARATKALTNFDVPGQRAIHGADQTWAAWMSPDELMLLCPASDLSTRLSAAKDATQGAHVTLADVSDARVVLDLTGEGAREALAKLSPADLDPSVFGPGELRRTRIAQVPCAFWMPDDATIRILVFRSVAQYAFDVLAEAIQTPVHHLV